MGTKGSLSASIFAFWAGRRWCLEGDLMFFRLLGCSAKSVNCYNPPFSGVDLVITGLSGVLFHFLAATIQV